MFEQMFRCPRALLRHQSGPLAEERRRYLVYCDGQQIPHRTLQLIASYMLIVAEYLHLGDRTGIVVTQAEIETGADRWANRRPRRSGPHNVRRSRRCFVGHALRWLTFLGRVQIAIQPPKPYAEHIAQFADTLLQDIGLAARTVESYREVLEPFFVQVNDAGFRLDLLTVSQVDELLIQMLRDRGYSRLTVQRHAAALRSFFRYSEKQGWCRRGLATAIMIPRVLPYEGLPASLSWDHVKQVLASAQGDRCSDIRNRALLLLLAVYGFRAGEVLGLRLENFDWDHDIFTISHGKRRKPQLYPLCPSVGNAIVRYLREARPRSNRRELFLTLRAPFRPLSGAGLWSVVTPRLHKLNVTLTHYGPHMLRHACATHLLAQGLSLKEIGDQFGHQRPESTRVYAKVDLAGLRAVADFELEGLL